MNRRGRCCRHTPGSTSTRTISEDGDLIRGIDTFGNAGFVRNVVEKARDHRSFRLDDEDLDAVLASDLTEFRRPTAALQGTDPGGSRRGSQRRGRREEVRLVARRHRPALIIRAAAGMTDSIYQSHSGNGFAAVRIAGRCVDGIARLRRLLPAMIRCHDGSASTSLGEASARIQATDLERRKTPRVRTAPPGLRVEPKWLPESSGYAVRCRSSDERGAATGSSAGSASSRMHRAGTPVCPGREEVRRNESQRQSVSETDDHFVRIRPRRHLFYLKRLAPLRLTRATR